jgi:hypothetical protein
MKTGGKTDLSGFGVSKTEQDYRLTFLLNIQIPDETKTSKISIPFPDGDGIDSCHHGGKG